MSKSRGREEKLRQKRQKEERRKNSETWKTPTNLWGFFLANFNYKTGEKLRFLTKMCPPVGVSPIYIYIHIYIYILTCFHASFFPFGPLCWPSLFLPFSGHLFALFSPSKSAQSLERGGFRTDLSRKLGIKKGPRFLLRGGSVPLKGPSVPLTGIRSPLTGFLFFLFCCRFRAWRL